MTEQPEGNGDGLFVDGPYEAVTIRQPRLVGIHYEAVYDDGSSVVGVAVQSPNTDKPMEVVFKNVVGSSTSLGGGPL